MSEVADKDHRFRFVSGEKRRTIQYDADQRRERMGKTVVKLHSGGPGALYRSMTGIHICSRPACKASAKLHREEDMRCPIDGHDANGHRQYSEDSSQVFA